jgi:ATP phosphoribosyltransferase regulatory subunit
MEDRKWRLPAGVDELLPPDAWALELLRRQVLDVFRLWGFEYIDPPVVEYLDALLVGAGDDMNLQTLKTVDQKTGRMLGVRADMTAQAVRVDAHSLPVEGVQRLCYAGNVVFANPVSPLDARNPLKAGAELFGAASPKADAEVIALMLEVLRVAGIGDPILVLGHMGIYQNLVADLELPPAREAALFTAVQSKAEGDIARLLEGSKQKPLMMRLPMLMGEREVLSEARTCLADAGAAVGQAIDQLESLADLVLSQAPDVELRFDLAELTGYGYHNGPVFSAYQAELGHALARGGRYDGIGAAFGRARPATGFDVILNELLESGAAERAIWVPWTDSQEAQAEQQGQVNRLRSQGEVVVSALRAEDDCPARCDRVLIQKGADWIVDPVSR